MDIKLFMNDQIYKNIGPLFVATSVFTLALFSVARTSVSDYNLNHVFSF